MSFSHLRARLAIPPRFTPWRSFSATAFPDIEVCLSSVHLLNPRTPSPQPSQLTVVRTANPRQLPPSSKLLFGRTFVRHMILPFVVYSVFLQSDHMLRIPWAEKSGWGAPSIEPCELHHPLSSHLPF